MDKLSRWRRGIVTLETLNSHIKMILDRHFVEEFAVAQFGIHLTVRHLKNADILTV